MIPSIEELNRLSGVEFEQLCATLLFKLGFQVETTKISGDGGIDILAYNSMPLYKGKYIVQCKRYSGTVGEPILRDLYGVVTSERANKGILMTTGFFTSSAVTFANNKQIELIDGNGIQSLIDQLGYEFQKGVEQFNYDKIVNILTQNYRESTFNDIQNELEYNPNKSTAYLKAGLFFYQQAIDGVWSSGYSADEKKALLQACIYYLSKIQGTKNKNDKENLMQKFISLWISAHAYFFSGDFKASESCYNQIFQWDELTNSYTVENGLLECLYAVIVDFASFYSITEQRDKALDLLYHSTYNDIIEQKKMLLTQDIHDNPGHQRYSSILLSGLNNILTDPLFYYRSFQYENLDMAVFYLNALKKYDCSDIIIDILAPEIYKMSKNGDKIIISTYSGKEFFNIGY